MARKICLACSEAAKAYIDEYMEKLRNENFLQQKRLADFEQDNARLKQAVEGGTLVATRLAEKNTELAAALETAIKIAGEARDQWDAAPSGMRAGKLLIALSDRSMNYRADITAMHAARPSHSNCEGKNQ